MMRGRIPEPASACNRSTPTDFSAYSERFCAKKLQTQFRLSGM